MSSLFALIVIPLAFAAYVAARPAKEAKSIALLGMLAVAAVTVFTMVQFDWSRGEAIQLEGAISWIPTLGGAGGEQAWGETSGQDGGLRLSVGVDSVAMLLIALTALLGPICILASFTAITERVKTYYAWFLVLQAAMLGVFAARDLVLFYICFEFTLIPMWLLIHLYGSTNRRKAATKFFLYTFTGSLVALAGLVYVAWFRSQISGTWSFDLYSLQAAAMQMSMREQSLVLLALLAGFAVKVPLFPFHTWLPLAHTEAPTAGSVVLAGVLLKLGTYGIYRFALPFAPAACYEYAPFIAVLSIIGIIYAGLICWVQTDVKKLVAYSSVAHLGFCILGMFAFNVTGLTGSVMYMINHGLSTGALFLLIGMVYERYHTRSMKELGGLASKMPVWASFMVFFTMASVGLPGLNGFVSEFLCLFGAFQAGPEWAGSPGATTGLLGGWYAFAAGLGMIIAAIYLLYMLGLIVWGKLVEPHGHDGHDSHNEHDESSHGSALPTDLNGREIGILLPLAVLCVAIGVYPKPLLDTLEGPTKLTRATVINGYARATAPPAHEPEEPAAPSTEDTPAGEGH
jgi:NADH-quinone oxidoreductase subunit M